MKPSPVLYQKIGENCEPGDVLTLSKKGNLRKAKPEDAPCGLALTKLIRGRIAFQNNEGFWQARGKTP